MLHKYLLNIISLMVLASVSLHAQKPEDTKGKQEALPNDGSVKSDDLEAGVTMMRYFFPSGKLKAQAPIIDGVTSGLKQVYREDGAMYYVASYVKGHVSGPMLTFDKNQRLIELKNYKDDVLDGPAITYYSSGVIKSSEEYKNGKLINSAKYSEGGKVIK